VACGIAHRLHSGAHQKNRGASARYAHCRLTSTRARLSPVTQLGLFTHCAVSFAWAQRYLCRLLKRRQRVAYAAGYNFALATLFRTSDAWRRIFVNMVWNCSLLTCRLAWRLLPIALSQNIAQASNHDAARKRRKKNGANTVTRRKQPREITIWLSMPYRA